jgi:hypothetical protein
VVGVIVIIAGAVSLSVGGPVAVADGSPSPAFCTMEVKQFAAVPGSPADRIVEPGTLLTGLVVGQRQDVVDWQMVEGWDAADGPVVVRPNPAGAYVVDTVEWLKDGRPAYGASATRTVTRKDVGSTFVQVVALSTGAASTCPARLGGTQAWKVMAKPKVAAKPVRASVPAAANAVVKVTVRADGVARPTGTVTVSVGAKKSTTVTMTRTDKGTVEITVPKLSRGTHKVRTTFTDGTGKIQDGAAKTFTVKVT